MGNCVRGTGDKEKIPGPKLNEHSHIQRGLTAGIKFEKSSDGEIIVGMKASLNTKKDKEYSLVLDESKEKEEDFEQKIRFQFGLRLFFYRFLNSSPRNLKINVLRTI